MPRTWGNLSHGRDLETLNSLHLGRFLPNTRKTWGFSNANPKFPAVGQFLPWSRLRNLEFPALGRFLPRSRLGNPEFPALGRFLPRSRLGNPEFPALGPVSPTVETWKPRIPRTWAGFSRTQGKLGVSQMQTLGSVSPERNANLGFSECKS